MNAEKSKTAFTHAIARPLGLSLERAAYGAYQITISSMIRAIKAVSSERGRDPREFSLFAFGGNGPLFAAGMAEALRMKHIIVPPSAGLFSSYGLLYANVEHHYSRTMRCMLSNEDVLELNQAWEALANAARNQLAAEGFRPEQIRLHHSARLRYMGQNYELTIPLSSGTLDKREMADLAEAFGSEHQRTYGHRAGKDEPVELVTVLVVGEGIPDTPRVPRVLNLPNGGPSLSARRAYFGPEKGWLETPVVHRCDLRTKRTGPCIVEEYDATCLIPPSAFAELDSYGNILISLA
jgi:N-methylhydantoinase A